MIEDNWSDNPKSYVWLAPQDYSDIREGDIVSLTHKDGPEHHLGRVVLMDEWIVVLNNRDEFFPLIHWNVSVLHRRS
jgi:hypothetical protein